MGYDLAGRDDASFYANISAWPFLLRLAYENGWKPEGTTDPFAPEAPDEESPGDWDGTYFSNDWQLVSHDDAQRLADALERALSDPERFRELGEENCQWVRKFIMFCRYGEFRIT